MSAYTQATGWYAPLDGRQYITTKPLSWEIGAKESGFLVTVPVDFVFDVSVPAWATWLFDPHNPNYLKAACLHDHLLHVRQWERVSAGAVFHNALKADGVALWRRVVMWLAVSLFRLS